LNILIIFDEEYIRGIPLLLDFVKVSVTSNYSGSKVFSASSLTTPSVYVVLSLRDQFLHSYKKTDKITILCASTYKLSYRKAA
jgi:hypothetical protein